MTLLSPAESAEAEKKERVTALIDKLLNLFDILRGEYSIRREVEKVFDVEDYISIERECQSIRETINE